MFSSYILVSVYLPAYQPVSLNGCKTRKGSKKGSLDVYKKWGGPYSLHL